MVTLNEELFASKIRKQIAYLEGLLKELESDPGHSKAIQLRMREVENQLHKLRSQIKD